MKLPLFLIRSAMQHITTIDDSDFPRNKCDIGLWNLDSSRGQCASPWYSTKESSPVFNNFAIRHVVRRTVSTLDHNEPLSPIFVPYDCANYRWFQCFKPLP